MSVTISREYSDQLFDGLFNYTFYSFSPIFMNTHLNVTASSANTNYGIPSDVINPFKNTFWHSENNKNSSIVISLIGFQISPTSYSLHSRNDNPNQFPLEWAFEGSNDCNTWTTIDAPGSNTFIGSLDKSHNFPIANPPKQFFTYLRFVGMKITSENYFILKKIELFGSMMINLPLTHVKQTVHCQHERVLHVFQFIFLVTNK